MLSKQELVAKYKNVLNGCEEGKAKAIEVYLNSTSTNLNFFNDHLSYQQYILENYDLMVDFFAEVLNEYDKFIYKDIVSTKLGIEIEGFIDTNIFEKSYNAWKYCLMDILNNEYPLDNMRQLAEFRTKPICKESCVPYIVNTAKALHSLYNCVAQQNGFKILWKEVSHHFDSQYYKKNGVKHNFLLIKDQSGNLQKIKKDIKSDTLRGGGLHVTISGILQKDILSTVDRIYQECYDLCPQYKSAYRERGLFRYPVFHRQSPGSYRLIPCLEIIGLSVNLEESDGFDKLGKIIENICEIINKNQNEN